MSIADTNESAFGEIALSLSGGGYRAASFHLGVLDLLNRLDLLQDVRVLSTVSGGTFTGMMHAVNASEGADFPACYDKLYLFLRGTNVIEGALQGLSRNEGKAQQVMPSLIKGAAQVYASEAMLGNKRFGQLMNGARNLTDIAFNSVEFRTGNSFRFQTSQSGTAIIGNGNLRVEKDVAAEIRLADIAAASSCFPSAFEPIRFPDDFTWPEGRSLEDVRRDLGEPFKECVPLMDGGIFDNQGIDSVAHIYQRVGKDGVDDVGLFIISDTSPRSENLLTFPVKNRKGWLTLGGVVRVAWALFMLSLITSVSLLLNGIHEFESGEVSVLKGAFLYVIPFIFSISISIALWWSRHRLKNALIGLKAKTNLALWSHVRCLSIPEVLELVESRIRSLIVLTTSVFMRRVRNLGYKDINVYPMYQGKLCPNLIYGLNDRERFGTEIKARGLEPSENLQALALDAERVSTNLWFTEEETLQNLIACGQATMCFNIMKYILAHKADDLSVPTSRISKTFTAAQTLWEDFKVNPKKLVRVPPQ
jgi:predicted acylesterase/phospholipase RssA